MIRGTLSCAPVFRGFTSEGAYPVFTAAAVGDHSPATLECTILDLAVVAVSYNSARDLPGFVGSLRGAAADLTMQVVVVDNSSRDDSVSVARELGTTCVDSGGNLGFAGGINRGLAAVDDSRAILIANPDVRFQPESVSLLYAECMRTGQVIVPAITDAAGEVRWSLRREPAIGGQFGEALFGDHLPGRPAWLSTIVRGANEYTHVHVVDWATGAVIMMPTECARQVGPWNEDFFLYSEEVDFAARVRDAGRSVRYLPDARVSHSEGASGRSSGTVSLDAANRIRYYRSRHNAWMTSAYASGVLLEMGMRANSGDHRIAGALILRVFWPAVLRGEIPKGGPEWLRPRR